MELIASDTVAPAPQGGGAITTERAAGIIAIGAIVFLGVVRRAFGGVLHP